MKLTVSTATTATYPQDSPISPSAPSARFDSRGFSKLKQNKQKTSIVVDLRSQTAMVFDGSFIVIKTPVSTGKPGFETPTGTFNILERKENHASSLYGKLVHARTGRVLKQGVDSRDETSLVDDNIEFKGAEMPYWNRLTWTGVGLHAGDVPGYPASHGCIRVPEQVMAMIHQVTDIGTTVIIQ
ncbi:MAG: L,D-transpeptidase family protein [Verrucomicrobiales bacterium]|nr:L,D-transpeptidase family protein [Verrucomicrobiales bacterium]